MVSWTLETMEMYGQSSPRNVSVNGQSFQGFWQIAQVVGSIRVKVLVDARAVEFSKVHAKIKDVKNFKVAQAVEFSKVHVWELDIQDKAVKKYHVFQVKV